ncbi:MAG: glycosyltransferase family 4 protein [Solirubrobacterales bacterium]
MAAALRALLESPLGERYELEVAPTYRGAEPLGRFFIYCSALAHLIGWSLRGRGRIVHVHATVRGSMYRKAVCVLAAKALRRRVVLQVHSGAGDIADFRAGRGRLSLALFRAAFRAADAVLAVSAKSADALACAYRMEPPAVVPNAAPTVAAFERPPAVDGELRVAYLGGFANPAKGGDVMLAALERALPVAPDLEVTMAGPGDLPPAGAELAREHPRLCWAGWLEAPERNELLRTAQVLVMPSRSEGSPMALLEAMAFGLAPVATEVGGIPELVVDGEEGLLVPSEDPTALADALGGLIRDPARVERLGVAARRRAERLDAVEVAGRLDALYARLL